MSKKLMIARAISAVIALNSSINTAAIAAPEGTEKCYGIVKAGQNDCSTAKHGCSGEAKIDKDPTEWIALPTGVCSKIVGGSIKNST